MKTHRLVPLFAVAGMLAITPSLRAAGDWEPLFDGLEYEDFYFTFEEDAEPKEVFKMEGGDTLVIKGKDHPEAYMQTLDEFENFELQFEWRWLGEPGDAGLMIHSDTDPYKSIWTHGLEIDLKHEHVGDLWLYGVKLEVEESQMPTKSAESDRRKNLKDGEKEKGYWNQMRVVAKDNTLQVFLNGELVNEAKDVKPQSGFISFMAQKADIEFRALQVRDF